MKWRKLVIIMLVLVIIITAIFLYLFLTRNRLLWDVPIISTRLVPTFLYRLQDNPADPMQGPLDVAIDELGRIYVTDTENNRVLAFDKDGLVDFSFGEAELERPYGIDVYSGRVYVADMGSGKIQVYSDRGAFLLTLATAGENGFDSFIPTGLAVERDSGDIYFADVFNHQVIIVDNKGTLKKTFGLPGSGKGEFAFPNGLSFDGQGNVVVSDSNNARVQVFSSMGESVLQVVDGKEEDGELSLPRGISVDSKGHVWVIDALTHSVHVFNGKRRVLRFGSMGIDEGELYFPNGLTVDDKGNIYITERGLNRVSVFGYRLANQ